MIDCNKGKISIGHNGNLTNAADWRASSSIAVDFPDQQRHESRRAPAAKSQARNLSGALGDALNQCEGAYSLVVLTPDELYAVRDPRDFGR